MSDIIWTEIEQGSPEWHEWRALGLGGSSAPIIMGVSPWKDPKGLFREMTGLAEKPDLSWAKRKGDLAEERCSWFLKEHYGLAMIPICAERTDPEDSWLRVSLDGADLEKNVIAEYKYASKKDHAGALRGSVPEKYWPQVQYQLFVTRAPLCYYVSYWEAADDYACIAVKPDKEYQLVLYNKMLDFWNSVKTNVEPVGPEHETEGDEAWIKQASKVRDIKDAIDTHQKQYKIEFDKLCKLTKSIITVGGGMKLTRTKGRETIDWDKVEEIKKAKESLTDEEIKKITKVGKPSYRFTYLKEK